MLKSKHCTLSPNTALGPRAQLVLPADEVVRRKGVIAGIHRQAAALLADAKPGLARNAILEIYRINYSEYQVSVVGFRLGLVEI